MLNLRRGLVHANDAFFSFSFFSSYLNFFKYIFGLKYFLVVFALSLSHSFRVDLDYLGNPTQQLYFKKLYLPAQVMLLVLRRTSNEYTQEVWEAPGKRNSCSKRGREQLKLLDCPPNLCMHPKLDIRTLSMNQIFQALAESAA